jgi:hypothetical protein
MMRKTLVTLFATIILSNWHPLTTAEPVKMSTSIQLDEYSHVVIPALSRALQEYGYSVVAESTATFQESLDNVREGKTPVALTPLDVAALNMTVENDPDENLLLMGGKILPQALFCAAYKEGNLVTYDDLTDQQTAPLKISVGNQDSETARTFQYLMTLDRKLSHIEFFYEEKTKIELNRLLSGRRDLVCFTTMPNPEHELIQIVEKHNDLFFITINNPSLAKAKIGQIRLYDLMEVPVSSSFLGFYQKKVKTLVTWLGVVVNEKQIDSKLLEAMSTVVMKPDLLPSDSLMGKAKQVFDKMVDRVEEMVD